MCKTIEISKCIECGAHPEITVSQNYGDVEYRVRCSKCNKTTDGYLHIEDAIERWTIINKPIKVKPRYICGYCGAELFLGFATCPECGIEIQW